MKVPQRMGGVVSAVVRRVVDDHGHTRQLLLPSRHFLSTSSSPSSSSHEAATDAKPVKYENVRKLIVGLGNPGEKFAKTRHNIGFMAVDHFLESYATQVLRTPLTFEHAANVHSDVVRFALPFQQDVAVDADTNVDHVMYTYRMDDLVNRASARRKAKTLADGVPHPTVNVALLKPTTFMNRSGMAVKTFMSTHQWRLKKNPMALNRQDELLVVTDDVALPFGTCRFKAKGGAGGQNGVRDIIKSVGTERFARLKIGVGAPHWFGTGSGTGSGAPAGTAIDKFVLARFGPDEQDALPLLLLYVDELLRLFVHRGLTTATTVANSMDLGMYRQSLKTSQRRAAKTTTTTTKTKSRQ